MTNFFNSNTNMLNLDTNIFFSFLALNLVVGLWYGRGVKTLREYAVGDKQFSTLVITLTIVATFLSGSAFIYALTIFYEEGFIAILKSTSKGLSLVVLGLLASRSGEFLNHLSIAESLGSIYGLTIRRIVSFSGIVFNIIIIAMQFKVGGDLVHILLGLSRFWSTLMVSSVVIFYSILGGIRSVTFTDLLQFIFFSIFVPFLAFIIWSRLGGGRDR
jgi:Na+/proline symporter